MRMRLRIRAPSIAFAPCDARRHIWWRLSTVSVWSSRRPLWNGGIGSLEGSPVNSARRESPLPFPSSSLVRQAASRRASTSRSLCFLNPFRVCASWTGLDWTGLVCSEPDATGQERAVGCAGEAFQHGHGHAWAYSCLPARRFARGDVEVLL
jgi:hypothetical protein